MSVRKEKRKSAPSVSLLRPCPLEPHTYPNMATSVNTPFPVRVSNEILAGIKSPERRVLTTPLRSDNLSSCTGMVVSQSLSSMPLLSLSDKLNGEQLQDEEWQSSALSSFSTRFTVYLKENGFVILENGTVPWLTATQVTNLLKDHQFGSHDDRIDFLRGTECIFLGSTVSGSNRFCVTMLRDSIHSYCQKMWQTRASTQDVMREHTHAIETVNILRNIQSKLHFHDAHQFCGVCGSRCRSVEFGLRRQCDGCTKRYYWRHEVSGDQSPSRCFLCLESFPGLLSRLPCQVMACNICRVDHDRECPVCTW
jgi:hypothetical protein